MKKLLIIFSIFLCLMAFSCKKDEYLDIEDYAPMEGMFVDNEVLINIKLKYKDKEFNIDDFPEVDLLELKDKIEFDDLIMYVGVLSIHDCNNVLEAIDKLKANEFILSVQPNYIYHLCD